MGTGSRNNNYYIKREGACLALRLRPGAAIIAFRCHRGARPLFRGPHAAGLFLSRVRLFLKPQGPFCVD